MIGINDSIGLTRDGLYLTGLKYNNNSDRPICGYIVYPKGHLPSSNFIEWRENGEFRYDREIDRLDIVKVLPTLPALTNVESDMFHFLMDSVSQKFGKWVETEVELSAVKMCCSLSTIASGISEICKHAESPTKDAVETLMSLYRKGVINIFDFNSNYSFVPKLYCFETIIGAPLMQDISRTEFGYAVKVEHTD